MIRTFLKGSSIPLDRPKPEKKFEGGRKEMETDKPSKQG